VHFNINGGINITFYNIANLTPLVEGSPI